jgi:hypothetical protein
MNWEIIRKNSFLSILLQGLFVLVVWFFYFVIVPEGDPADELFAELAKFAMTINIGALSTLILSIYFAYKSWKDSTEHKTRHAFATFFISIFPCVLYIGGIVWVLYS